MLVNKRTVSATMSERVLNAEYIKHRGFAFERIESGKFNIVPTEGLFSMLYVFVFKFQALYIDDRCRLVSKIRLLHIILMDFYLVLILLAGLVFVFTGAFESAMLTMFAAFMLVSVIVLQLFAVQFLAFNEIESALRRAEYVG